MTVHADILVLTITDILVTNTQHTTTKAEARGMVQHVRHSSCGDLAVVGPPVKFSRTPSAVRSEC